MRAYLLIIFAALAFSACPKAKEKHEENASPY
jgi:hypothetical protein